MGTGNVTEASDDSDTAMYYNIGGDDVHLAAPVGIAATAGDTYVVTFTLDGMVFQNALAAGDLDHWHLHLGYGWGVWRQAGGVPADSTGAVRNDRGPQLGGQLRNLG